MSVQSEVIRVFNQLLASGKKISSLTALPSSVQNSDLFEVVRSGVNYKATGSQLPSGTGGGINIQTIDTSTSSIVLDLDDTGHSVLSSTDPLTGNVTITQSGETGAAVIDWIFTVSGSDGSWGLNMNDFIMDDVRWQSVASKRWTPEADGEYLLHAVLGAGGWMATIGQPYS